MFGLGLLWPSLKGSWSVELEEVCECRGPTDRDTGNWAKSQKCQWRRGVQEVNGISVWLREMLVTQDYEVATENPTPRARGEEAGAWVLLGVRF